MGILQETPQVETGHVSGKQKTRSKHTGGVGVEQKHCSGMGGEQRAWSNMGRTVRLTEGWSGYR